MNELGKCEDCGFNEYVDLTTGRGCKTKKCSEESGNNYFKLNKDGTCTECTQAYQVASFGGRECIEQKCATPFDRLDDEGRCADCAAEFSTAKCVQVGNDWKILRNGLA